MVKNNPQQLKMPRKKTTPNNDEPEVVKSVKKKRATKPKIVKKPAPKVDEELLIEEADAKLIEELAMVAIKKHFENLGHMAKQAEDPFNKYLTGETKKDYETLAMILTEYLDSFIILGYRPDGEMLAMQKYHNQRDKSALESTLQRMAMGQMGFKQ